MKYNIQKIIGYIFALLIFIFIANLFYAQWNEISDIKFSFSWPYLLFAFVLGFLNLFAFTGIWYLTLKSVDKKINVEYIILLDIFIKSWLGRYLPGKIWISAGKIYLGAKEGISKKALSLSVFFEAVLSIIGHAIMALMLSLFLFSEFVSIKYLSVIAIALMIMIFFLLNRNILFKLFKPVLKIKKLR